MSVPAWEQGAKAQSGRQLGNEWHRIHDEAFTEPRGAHDVDGVRSTKNHQGGSKLGVRFCECKAQTQLALDVCC